MKNAADDQAALDRESPSDAKRERVAHAEATPQSGPPEADSPEADSPEGNAREDGAARNTTEPRTFTVVRNADESGVSGTGRVLDGCIFHNGQVVICWRGDINSEKSGYSSLAIYPCWEAFHNVHIGSHPGNETEVVFGQSADLMSRLVDRAAERDSSVAGQNESEEAEAA